MSYICSEKLNLNKESDNFIIHKIDTKFHCNKCNKYFKRKVALDTHLKTHKSLEQTNRNTSKLAHHCDVCSKFFNYPNDLENRKLILTDLPKEFRFRKYSCISNFMTVKKNKDGRMSKIYSCDLCPKKTEQTLDFRRHIAKHFPEMCKPKTQNNSKRLKKKYSCKVCDKEYYTGFNFRRHLNNKTHLIKLGKIKMNEYSKRIYSCYACDEKFDRSFNFRRHIIRKHRIQLKNEMKEVSVNIRKIQIKGLDLGKLRFNSETYQQNSPNSETDQPNNLVSPPKHLSEESKFAVHVYASEILDMDVVKQEQDDLDQTFDLNIQENLDHFVSVFHQQTNITATEDVTKANIEKAITEANSNLEKTLLKENLKLNKGSSRIVYTYTEPYIDNISDLKEIYSEEDIPKEKNYAHETNEQKNIGKRNSKNKNEPNLSWRRDLRGLSNFYIFFLLT